MLVSKVKLPHILKMLLTVDKNLLESKCMGYYVHIEKIPLAGFQSCLAYGHNAFGNEPLEFDQIELFFGKAPPIHPEFCRTPCT